MGRDKIYGWTHWQPEKEWEPTTFISMLCAYLWEDSEDHLIANMCIDKDLSEEAMKSEIIEWLDENIPKHESD